MYMYDEMIQFDLLGVLSLRKLTAMVRQLRIDLVGQGQETPRLSRWFLLRTLLTVVVS